MVTTSVMLQNANELKTVLQLFSDAKQFYFRFSLLVTAAEMKHLQLFKQFCFCFNAVVITVKI